MSFPSNAESLASFSVPTCIVGITRTWEGACGLRSLNASMPSPRLTTSAGISPAAILQKTQLLTVPQGPPNRIPELAALLLRRRVFDLAQFLEQLALLRRQLVRGPDVDSHVHIA